VKKTGIILLGLTLGIFALAGCGKKEQNASQQVEIEAGTPVVYACSMHPEVLSSGPGKCNVCGMNLEEKENTASAGVQFAYVCPMNDQPGLPAGPGKCDKCGMDLVKTGYVVAFVCPTHPGQVGSAAGKCAVCGMEMKADTSFLENRI
jgi:heavy metal-binding protein